jgi:FkbM family methyltransferase
MSPLPHGALVPDRYSDTILQLTSLTPDNVLGRHMAKLLRRLVMRRLERDGGVDVERWGVKLRLHPRDNGCEKALLFTPHTYDRVELHALEREIANSASEFVFVDVGANVGLFSLFVATHCPHARILAIEPEPGNIARLRFSLDNNPDVQIEVLEAAAAAAPGEVWLKLDTRDRGGTHTRGRDGIRVKAITLADAVRPLGRVDAMKIDIEGMELDVLGEFFRSADRQLWPRLLIVEVTRDDPRGLIAKLRSAGYTVEQQTRQNAMLRLVEPEASRHSAIIS